MDKEKIIDLLKDRYFSYDDTNESLMYHFVKIDDIKEQVTGYLFGNNDDIYHIYGYIIVYNEVKKSKEKMLSVRNDIKINDYVFNKLKEIQKDDFDTTIRKIIE
jgi:hypothetical protein